MFSSFDDPDSIEYYCNACFQNSKEHGFWGVAPRNKGEMIALIHSECSELLEFVHKPQQSDHIPEFSGELEELADILIRVFDYAGGHGMSKQLEAAIRAKMEYNRTRPFKHGKIC